MKTNLDDFTLAYVTAALWTFDEDAPSGDYETSGRFEEIFPKIAPETLEKMKADCAKFQEENYPDLGGHSPSEGGHCFWLSRNGHGSGFFDSEHFTKDSCEFLQKAAKAFKECDLYFGDDGMIYC